MMPSPTSGMNLGQRVAHVGGRTRDDHCVEFGSWLAVSLLVEHFLRDLKHDTPPHSNVPVVQRIEALEKKHGSLRAAANACGIDPGYLCRLKNSEKMNPSEEVLSALGLERVIYYRDKQIGGEV